MYKIQNNAATVVKKKTVLQENELLLNNLRCMSGSKEITLDIASPVLDNTLRKNLLKRHANFDKGRQLDKFQSKDIGHLLNRQCVEPEGFMLHNKEQSEGLLRGQSEETRVLRSEESLALDAQIKLMDLLDTQTRGSVAQCSVCVSGAKEHLDLCNTCYKLMKDFCGTQGKRKARIAREL